MLSRAASRVVGLIGLLALIQGVALFAAPALIIPFWPWPLTPLTARVIGAVFCLGCAGLSTWRDRRWSSLSLLLDVALLMIVAILAGAVRALDEFNPHPHPDLAARRRFHRGTDRGAPPPPADAEPATCQPPPRLVPSGERQAHHRPARTSRRQPGASPSGGRRGEGMSAVSVMPQAATPAVPIARSLQLEVRSGCRCQRLPAVSALMLRRAEPAWSAGSAGWPVRWRSEQACRYALGARGDGRVVAEPVHEEIVRFGQHASRLTDAVRVLRRHHPRAPRKR